MCYQECALYGELVLWLRNRVAELLAGEQGNVESETIRLDTLIREWFFAPQDNLHGCAPRDLIWAEQMGRPNPIHPERIAEFFEDDCPVCHFEHENLKRTQESGEDPGFHWHHDDGGCPLISLYDPEGWDARWAEADAWMAEPTKEREHGTTPAALDYEPLPIDSRQLDPASFIQMLRRPWMDPALSKASRTFAEHCDVGIPDSISGMRYRRVTFAEAVSILAGLDRQGTDVNALLAQIDSWPYENLALDWLSEPERNVAAMCEILERRILDDDKEGQRRFRQHRDFVLALAQVLPVGARLWLQGWLEATALGPSASDLPF